MSLSASGTTEKVDCGTGSTLANIDQGSVCLWCNLTSVANAVRNFFGKTPANGGIELFKRGSDGTIPRFAHGRATTPLLIDANTGTLSTGTEIFLAFTWDINSLGNCKAYKGTLTTNAADVTNGGTTTTGSGSPADDSATAFKILNGTSETTALPGAISSLVIFKNKVLTLGEIIEQQWHPHNDVSCVGYWQLGFNGTGTQPDWSGNGNNGTVTGAVQAAHVPLGPQFGWQAEWDGAFSAAFDASLFPWMAQQSPIKRGSVAIAF